MAATNFAELVNVRNPNATACLKHPWKIYTRQNTNGQYEVKVEYQSSVLASPHLISGLVISGLYEDDEQGWFAISSSKDFIYLEMEVDNNGNPTTIKIQSSGQGGTWDLDVDPFENPDNGGDGYVKYDTNYDSSGYYRIYTQLMARYPIAYTKYLPGDDIPTVVQLAKENLLVTRRNMAIGSFTYFEHWCGAVNYDF